jgi:hypothetical protein
MGRSRKRRRHNQGVTPAEKWEHWQLLAAVVRIAASVLDWLFRDPRFRL